MNHRILSSLAIIFIILTSGCLGGGQEDVVDGYEVEDESYQFSDFFGTAADAIVPHVILEKTVSQVILDGETFNQIQTFTFFFTSTDITTTELMTVKFWVDNPDDWSIVNDGRNVNTMSIEMQLPPGSTASYALKVQCDEASIEDVQGCFVNAQVELPNVEVGEYKYESQPTSAFDYTIIMIDKLETATHTSVDFKCVWRDTGRDCPGGTFVLSEHDTDYVLRALPYDTMLAGVVTVPGLTIGEKYDVKLEVYTVKEHCRTVRTGGRGSNVEYVCYSEKEPVVSIDETVTITDYGMTFVLKSDTIEPKLEENAATLPSTYLWVTVGIIIAVVVGVIFMAVIRKSGGGDDEFDYEYDEF